MSEFAMAIFGFLAICCFLFLIIYCLWFVLRGISGRIFRSKKVPETVPLIQVEHILQGRFSYYNQLDQPQRQRFVIRLQKFIAAKAFIGRGGLVVTEEMKVLIAASAIQVSFGLDKFLFDHFGKIFIYPRTYYNRFTKKEQKGEVNLAGAIVFSWEHFQEGYRIGNDNFNLGLHEMAHALKLDKVKGDGYDRFFAEYLDKFIRVSLPEFTKSKRHEGSFFRDYAGTNLHEFFAVCVEYFFESPQEFKEKLPELYKHLCVLLNQDPCEKNHGLQARQILYNKSQLKLNEGTLLLETLTKPTSAIKDVLGVLAFVILFICIATTFKISTAQFIFYTSISLLSLASNLFGYTTFALFSTHLAVRKNLFGFFNKRQFRFSYENIVCIKLVDAQKERAIRITYFDGRKVEENTYGLRGVSDQEIIRMGHLFIQNNILVKTNRFDWHEKGMIIDEKLGY